MFYYSFGLYKLFTLFLWLGCVFTLTFYEHYCPFQLFAAAFPLAPFIALVVLFLDKYIDAKRLLWLNRRPVAFIAQDIGNAPNYLYLSN